MIGLIAAPIATSVGKSLVSAAGNLYKGKRYMSPQEANDLVKKAWREVFGKEPTKDEVAYWAGGPLHQGKSYEQVVAEFRTMPGALPASGSSSTPAGVASPVAGRGNGLLGALVSRAPEPLQAELGSTVSDIRDRVATTVQRVGAGATDSLATKIASPGAGARATVPLSPTAVKWAAIAVAALVVIYFIRQRAA